MFHSNVQHVLTPHKLVNDIQRDLWFLTHVLHVMSAHVYIDLHL